MSGIFEDSSFQLLVKSDKCKRGVLRNIDAGFTPVAFEQCWISPKRILLRSRFLFYISIQGCLK